MPLETTSSAPFAAADWSSFLTGELGRRVDVRFGSARRNVIVVREQHGTLHVRMNRVFGEAPHDVRVATAAWLRAGKRARRACERLDGWIDEVATRLRPTRRVPVRTAGEHHDLAEIAAGLFEREFGETDFPLGRRPVVTWGRRARRGARRSLLLGSFDPVTNLVRVHPVLDQGAVPRFFVRYILFHEILHAAVPAERPRNGRAVHHGPRFRTRERAYAGYGEAIAWQDANLAPLLRSARSGKPIPARRTARGLLAPAHGLLETVQGLLFPDA